MGIEVIGLLLAGVGFLMALFLVTYVFITTEEAHGLVKILLSLFTVGVGLIIIGIMIPMFERLLTWIR